MRGTTPTETSLKFYKVMVKPTLLYGSRHGRGERTRKTGFKPQKLDLLEQEEYAPEKVE
jgi:hypothetical protein